jgi:predicted lipid carrier protein YhbT
VGGTSVRSSEFAIGHVAETPPLPSLFRIVGHAMRNGPARIADAVLSRVAASISARHPALLQRLAPYDGKIVTIVIEDVGVAINLRLGPRVALTLAGKGRSGCDAVVSGNWLPLVALLEGRVDGDALFFSRALSFEGETDLLLAIRNALDGARIDVVAEIAATFGSAAPAFRRFVPPVLGTALRVGRFVDRIHAAALAPAMARCELLAADLERMQRQTVPQTEAARGQARRRNRPPAND